MSRHTFIRQLFAALGVCAFPGIVLAAKSGSAELPDKSDGAASARPLVIAYQAELRAALAKPPYVLPLKDMAEPERQNAQRIALQSSAFTEALRGGLKARAEVMGVYALRESDLVLPALAACKGGTDCYRVEAYDHVSGDSHFAFVNVKSQTFLTSQKRIGIAPEVSPGLEKIAIEIATTSPLVKKVLGRVPKSSDFLMVNTRTSIARSRCERSQHLCVAPTLVEGNAALFVVVDLTSFKVVGTRWTKLGNPQQVPTIAPSEKRVQNEAMARQYCERETAVERDGWRFKFQITSSDGVRVSEVSYQGKPWLASVKTVDWHVGYSWKDRFGYSDAVGCPVFSQAAVAAIDPPEFIELKEGGQVVGFSLQQDFRSEQWPRPCNYYYRQRFDFFSDGRFRPVAASLGRGCGDDATYRPVTRIEFIDAVGVGELRGGSWQRWTHEGYRVGNSLSADSSSAKLAFLHRAEGQTTKLIPNDGGFEGSRGDNPWLYVTIHPPGRDEGASDISSLGTCCNTDHRQGPEKFLTPPEPLAGAPLVLWYVAQLKNDPRAGRQYCWADFVLKDGVNEPVAYPCYSGPILRRDP